MKRLCLSIVPLALALVAGAQRGPNSGAIVGTVKESRGGFPAHRLEVRLETRGSLYGVQFTDAEGRFGFSDLPSNLYHLTIDDDEYVPYSTPVSIGTRTGQIEYLQIQLEPKKKEDKKDDDPKPTGGNPFMVDARDLSKLYPHDAVKAFEAAVKAMAANKPDDAVKGFSRAIELAPGFYQARNNLGTLLLNRSDFKGAEEQFVEVLKVQQGDAAGYFNLGNVMLLTKRYDEAAKLLQDGLRKQPNNATGQFLMGTLYCRTGKPAEGEKMLISASQADPSMSRIHLELVNLYLSQGRKDDAKQQLNFFLTAYPSDPMVPQVKQVLAKLQGQP